MRQKILVIALGGTIGSTRDDTIHPDENNLKILDVLPDMDTDYEAVSLFNILSENMNREYLRKLFDCLNGVNFSDCNGVIILHGSDTLAYTAAFLGNAYGNEHIVLVASDKPIEAADSNGIKNFCDAVTHIKSEVPGVFISYDGIKPALCTTSAGIDDKFDVLSHTLPPLNKKIISDRNILIIQPYIDIDINNYNFDNCDGVLFAMYHSATVPDSIIKTAMMLKEKNKEYHFVTHKESADYETASDLCNILFSCTIENAYARMILTNENDVV